jgi:hypothetical protein
MEDGQDGKGNIMYARNMTMALGGSQSGTCQGADLALEICTVAPDAKAGRRVGLQRGRGDNAG